MDPSLQLHKSKILNTLRAFQTPDNGKSFWIFAALVVVLLGLVLGSSIAYTIHPAYCTIFWIPIEICLGLMFIILHDCDHRAYFKSPLANEIAGRISGFFIMIPAGLWQFIHDQHHGAVGNLDRRSENPDLWTLTIDEYKESSNLKKLAYRIVRSGFMRFVMAPIILSMVLARIPNHKVNLKSNISVITSNICYGVILWAVLTYASFSALVMVYLVPLYLFFLFGTLIFYLQHQYEDTYWENEADWDLFEASLVGSSYLKFSPVMRLVTGNVGYHHIHHLNAKIPFYKLHKAGKLTDQYFTPKPIYFSKIMECIQCKIWDEDQKKLIPWSELK